MGKVFGIFLIVLGVWVGLEVMNNGMGGAFDGLFVSWGIAAPDEAEQPSVTQRAAGAWERAHRDAEERVARQLE